MTARKSNPIVKGCIKNNHLSSDSFGPFQAKGKLNVSISSRNNNTDSHETSETPSIHQYWGIKDLIAYIGEGDFTQSDDKVERRYYLVRGLNRDQYLTSREAQCLVLSLKGLTAKVIAKNMNLSPRTVESYFEKLRHKFDCHRLQELVFKLFHILKLENPDIY